MNESNSPSHPHALPASTLSHTGSKKMCGPTQMADGEGAALSPAHPGYRPWRLQGALGMRFPPPSPHWSGSQITYLQKANRYRGGQAL